jgi:phosphopantetheine adenylyltransferase|tara:strand:+ start:194 stop:445 length:252 start_codon:yes stop_codon:yes gene_type:complete
MMKKDIYKKARKIFDQSRVKVDNETSKAIYFTVEGDKDKYSVIMQSDGKLSCTCPYSSIHANKEVFCSHICATIAMTMFSSGE